MEHILEVAHRRWRWHSCVSTLLLAERLSRLQRQLGEHCRVDGIAIVLCCTLHVTPIPYRVSMFQQVESLERNGGRALVKADVDEIIIDATSQAATAVRFKTGETINARRGIVSSAG